MVSRELVECFLKHSKISEDNFISTINKWSKNDILNIIYSDDTDVDRYYNNLCAKVKNMNNIKLFPLKYFYRSKDDIRGKILFDSECYNYIIREQQKIINDVCSLVRGL